MKISKITHEISRLNIAPHCLSRYQDYIEAVRAHEATRLGYPVVGAEDSTDYDLGIVPHSIFDIYLNNIGNPYDMPQSFYHHAKIFEQEAIALCAHYLGLCPSTRGYITSGGTEGNFAGIWWAREILNKQSPGQGQPTLILSKAAHYSVFKAGQQLALEVTWIETSSRGAMDLARLEHTLIHHPIEKPIILVATLGTTQTGGMDDVLAIRDLLDTHIIRRGGMARLHLDAALIGLAIPVICPSTSSAILEAVDSLAISAHKLLASRVLISGIVLTSEEYLSEIFSDHDNKVSYIGDIQDITVSGSRSGVAAIALHHRLMQLEFDKNGEPLKKTIMKNIELAEYFRSQLAQIIPSEEILLGDNQLTLVFPRPHGAEDLIKQYSLMPVDDQRLGVCVLSHVNTNRIDALIQAYRSLI